MASPDAVTWETASDEQKEKAIAELRGRLAEYHRRTASARGHVQFLSAVQLGLIAVYGAALAQTQLRTWPMGAALAVVAAALLQTLWVARTNADYGWRVMWRPFSVYRLEPTADAGERALNNTDAMRFRILARKVDDIRAGVWRRYAAQRTATVVTMASVVLAGAGALAGLV